MSPFRAEILMQASALRAVVGHYGGPEARAPFAALARPTRVVLTGMGASFHVALCGSHLLRARGIWAIAVESSDLLYFGGSLLLDVDHLVFISQSGASAEVAPLLEAVGRSTHVIGITNDPASPLGVGAHTVMPLCAGSETTVATKTYLNSLACLWLLGQAWHHGHDERDLQDLLHVAGLVEGQLARYAAIEAEWSSALAGATKLCFLGHGPHVATARQAAMMLGEWPKVPALGTSIGAFRHGLIEIVDGSTGVVVFGAAGSTADSVTKLTRELESYGATVLHVVEGRSWSGPHLDEATRTLDELLSPFLDVVPAQIFAETYASRLGVDTTFRHIQKVIETL
jgi:glutamine---fructose-6-phosphate transaminase (isomerizing)